MRLKYYASLLEITHVQKREMNTILGDIIKHMTPDRAFESHYSQVGVVCMLMHCCSD